MDLKTGQDTSTQEQETLSETEKDRKSQRHKALQGNQSPTTKAERQSYWQFVVNIIEVGDPDRDQQPKQKRFWSYIKSIRKDTTGGEWKTPC